MNRDRRQFLIGAAGAGLATSLFNPFGCAASPEGVRFSGDIEPLVRLLEDTPREKVFEAVAHKLKKGLPYQRLMSALFLAGIRNVNPQPPGFKFHCVFEIHAAHQLSLAAPVDQRLLPFFWALDDFKNSQQKDVKEGDFVLQPVRGKLPSAEKAWREFHAAMEDWDEARADRAIAVLVRSRGAHEVIEELWKYGARDYRNIGHKPIFVANCWRTLQTVGWRHAEPVLRSLVLGLLDFGKTERVNAFAFDDQCYLPNLELVQRALPKLPADWAASPARLKPPDENGQAVTQDLLAAIRAGDFGRACGQATNLLLEGKSRAPSIWDAVHLAAAELMMRQPGIYGIHTVTSVNGLRYAFETAANAENRLLMVLQGVGWMCQFTRFMSQAKGGLNSTKITEIAGARSISNGGSAAKETFALIGKDTPQAARRAFAYGQANPQLGAFGDLATRLVVAKTTEVHGFKYPAAIFEDWRLVSPVWRPHLLAASVYYLPGSSQTDSPVIEKARDALRGV